MKDSGFEAVRRCDPYIEGAIDYPNGVRIDNQGLDDVSTKFDVVMAHHVMEHVPNQLEFAQQLFARLNDSGMAIIRLPTSSSWVFEYFGSDWFQLDAPRHLFLHTSTSVERVLREAGFTNLRIRDDSTIWQVLSSRLYREGVPFNNHLRWYLRHLPGMLISGEFKKLNNEIDQLNAQGLGDQICIIAEKHL